MGLFHGSKGRVIVNGVPLKMKKVSTKVNSPKIETTNSESATLTDGRVAQELLEGGGIPSLEGSCECEYDYDSTPFGAPPSLFGITHVAMEVYLKKGGKKVTLNAHIEEIEANQEVRSTDAVGYSFSFSSSGAFTVPS